MDTSLLAPAGAWLAAHFGEIVRSGIVMLLWLKDKSISRVRKRRPKQKRKRGFQVAFKIEGRLF